ncbi:Biotin carboxyl carrier protein of acetyl-CoA carboxylase 1- chloroplastic [Striga hermonthica]|uniref:Biotin carboxyl carrier protein of acetyl-CoA carboxylase n=1 Tax=Striga hermonthica TaxID=68872 RepID=A0A9N7N9C2_STRHE|nr:Biotin carboxyl carrier protein of acetyl-CoA carboxylase 1- chloroplastic [Striga hermonthica]
MAASFGAAAASSVKEIPNISASSYLPICRRHLSYLSHSDKVALLLSAKPDLRLYTKSVRSGWNSSPVVRAQMNEAATDGSAKTAVKLEGSLDESKEIKLSNEPPASLRSEESISEFIDQVASLVKLVDSKDIVELQLKQVDCEILIRKKEALPQPPVQYIQTLPQPLSQPQPAITPPVHSVSPVPTAEPSPQPKPALALPAAKSSLPSFKCPMAGTFYRSPAPGEPPFVKVGDQVTKGQVLCIIEAMKLMNEIEADQSGTLVEILVDDAKPVSVGAPLFVIQQ